MCAGLCPDAGLSGLGDEDGAGWDRLETGNTRGAALEGRSAERGEGLGSALHEPKQRHEDI